MHKIKYYFSPIYHMKSISFNWLTLAFFQTVQLRPVSLLKERNSVEQFPAQMEIIEWNCNFSAAVHALLCRLARFSLCFVNDRSRYST